jgi:hypothetical protein
MDPRLKIARMTEGGFLFIGLFLPDSAGKMKCRFIHFSTLLSLDGASPRLAF